METQTVIEINKYNKLLQPLQFVVSAKAKESTRYAIDYLYVEDTLAIATDGKRMHWFEHDLLKTLLQPGFYKVKKNTKTMLWLEEVEDVGNFPKWQALIPEHKKHFLTNTEHWTMFSANLGFLEIGINPESMQPFALISYESIKISFGESDRPVLFEIQDIEPACKALIMPVKYTKPNVEIN